MNDMKSNWEDLRLFLSVAREGGLSSAARASGSSPATLARRMLALERATGKDLFVRHDRGYELTADGRMMLADLADVETRIDALATPQGPADQPVIKVSAGTWTTLHLLSHIDTLAGTPPDLQLRFIASEDILDMPHREVAIGFRLRRPQEPNLAGKKIAQVTFAAYATEDAPDLWIKVIANTPSAQWLAKMAGPDIACEVTAPRNSLDLALGGVGKAVLPTFIGDMHPSLKRRSAPIADLTHDQWIVTHQDDRHLPEVRRALERLYKVFA